MKIAVLFTGGTIGSYIGASGQIAPAGTQKYMLLDMYRKTYVCDAKPVHITENKDSLQEQLCGEEVEFVTAEPYEILSENLDAGHLLHLIHCLRETLESRPAGVIITHGTDTLQYTAAILQYLFADAGVPILLVSSAYVLTDPRANGLVNFAAAVAFIREKHGRGVFVSYCNKGDVPTFHLGTRLQSVISYSDEVRSILDSWYGRYEAGGYAANPAFRIHSSDKGAWKCQNPVFRLRERTGEILWLRSYPGMSLPELTHHTKAVLLEGYHCGTLEISESLQTFAEKASELNIPVFVTGLTESAAEYETVEMWRSMGIRPLVNRAAVAQYCRLWMAFSNGLDPVLEEKDSIAGDWV